MADLEVTHLVPVKPWLLVGDFNEILFVHEKTGEAIELAVYGEILGGT